VKAPQFTGMNGRGFRGELSCRCASNQFLARAALAADQHGRIGALLHER
jgi:hypothetical protein